MALTLNHIHIIFPTSQIAPKSYERIKYLNYVTELYKQHQDHRGTSVVIWMITTDLYSQINMQ